MDVTLRCRHVDIDLLRFVCCRVPDNENLFDGQLAPVTPDQSEIYQRTFCVCNSSKVCGRRAVSDTTADSSEPQRNVRLGVPFPFHGKRRKRRATGSGQTLSTGSRRTYSIYYEYVSKMHFHLFACSLVKNNCSCRYLL